jgi:hypothetical protein
VLVGVGLGVVLAGAVVAGLILDRPGGGSPAPMTGSVAPAVAVAAFEGEIGQLASGAAFRRFVSAHDGRVVRLDVRGRPGEPHFSTTGNPAHFVLYDARADACPASEVGPGCTGTEYDVLVAGPETGSAFDDDQGFPVLRGHFAISAAPGVHQGLLRVTLRAVPAGQLRADTAPVRPPRTS